MHAFIHRFGYSTMLQGRKAQKDRKFSNEKVTFAVPVEKTYITIQQG